MGKEGRGGREEVGSTVLLFQVVSGYRSSVVLVAVGACKNQTRYKSWRKHSATWLCRTKLGTPEG